MYRIAFITYSAVFLFIMIKALTFTQKSCKLPNDERFKSII